MVNVNHQCLTMSTRTASIGIRVQPEIKTAAEKAAQADHRTVASLVEKLLIEHLRDKGYLKMDGDKVGNG